MTLFSRYDPATEDLVWQGNSASKEEIDDVFVRARQVFTPWSRTSFEVRKQFLQRFQEELEKKRTELIHCISQETGKPLWDAGLEVQTLHAKIGFTLESYAARCGDRVVSHPSAKSITRSYPLGVAVVLGPFNFPAHIPHGHIFPALLMGNTVIWKPSPYTPKTSEMLMEIWQAAGLPSDVLQLLQGGSDVGQSVVAHANWDLLAYTGSSHVGHKILDATRLHPEKLIALEMGGNNPLIISGFKDLKAAVYTIIQSAFLSTGQRCTCARRLIVVKNDTTEQLVQALVKGAQALSIGPHTKLPEPFMGPLISADAVSALLKEQDSLIQRQAKPLLLAKRLELGKAFISPAILDVTDVLDRKDEELFGPFLQLVYVSSLEEAIKEANNTRYGLTAGLISDEPKEYETFRQTIRAGLINWNTPLTGASSAMPFGGIGWSGNHRPAGFYAIDSCCYPVASMEKSALSIPEKPLPGLHLDGVL